MFFLTAPFIERLLLGVAGALRGSGKSREAVLYLEEAYAREPSDRLAFELASALQKAGHNKEALALLSKIEPRKSHC